MYGRRPRCKRNLTFQRSVRVQPCIRPFNAATLAAGPDVIRKKAHDAAVALSKRPAGSLTMTKRLMRDHQRIAAQIAEEGQLFKERLKTAEAREAFAAFAERRPPNFARVSA